MQLNVLFNRLLTPKSAEREIYHLALCANETDALNYESGDWLLVHVHNPNEQVEAILSTLGLQGNEPITLPRVGEVTAQTALTQHLEINQLPAASINKAARQYQLSDWPDRTSMLAYAFQKDMLDLIKAFPQLSGVDALKIFSPLAPRYYSIASSPIGVGQNRVDLVFRKMTFFSENRQRLGLASGYMSHLKEGDTLQAQVMRNAHFKLPELCEEDSQGRKIIMVGAGTGVAPYIGFLQDCYEGQNPVKNQQAWLFFGETERQNSFFFEDDLTRWQAQGLKLTTVFSRDQAEKIYVQHRLWENRAEVWQWLMQGAVLYACGDEKKMAGEVESTLLAILQAEGNLTQEDATQQWKEWRKERRVQFDVY